MPAIQIITLGIGPASNIGIFITSGLGNYGVLEWVNLTLSDRSRQFTLDERSLILSLAARSNVLTIDERSRLLTLLSRTLILTVEEGR